MWGMTSSCCRHCWIAIIKQLPFPEVRRFNARGRLSLSIFCWTSSATLLSKFQLPGPPKDFLYSITGGLKPSSDLSLVFEKKLPCWWLTDVNSCLLHSSVALLSLSLFVSFTLLSPFSGSFQSLSLNEPNSGSVALFRVQHWLSNTWSVALFRVSHYLKLFTGFVVIVRIVFFQHVITGTFNKKKLSYFGAR